MHCRETLFSLSLNMCAYLLLFQMPLSNMLQIYFGPLIIIINVFFFCFGGSILFHSFTFIFEKLPLGSSLVAWKRVHAVNSDSF